MESEFECDLKPRHRAAWQQVRLENSEKLTLRDWKHFANEFEIRRNRVESWTEEQEYDHLMKQLPQEWRLKIVSEENRRKRTQFWVALLGGPAEPLPKVRKSLEGLLDIDVGQIIPVSEGYEIACNSEEDRQSMLGLNGDELDGHQVRAIKFDKRMGGEATSNL